MLIGLVGTICAGKTEASKYTHKQYGHLRLSTRDEVVLEAEARELETNRPALQKLGYQLETEFPGYWSRRLIARIIKNKNYIIEGLRSPKQIEIFQVIQEFTLLGIDAPFEIRRFRYEKIRKREGDIDFKTADQNDRYKLQKTNECLEMAAEIYNNNESLVDLYYWIDSKVGGQMLC